MDTTITDTPADQQAQDQTPDSPYSPDFWDKQIKSSDEAERIWRIKANDLTSLYRAEAIRHEQDEDDGARYNIFFANTEVLQGVMYQQTPVPDVRPRFKKKDLVSLAVAEILEKALEFELDTTDFDDLMAACVLDRLTVGRGQARVRYKAEMIDVEVPQELQPPPPPSQEGQEQPPPDQETPKEKLTYQKVVSESAPIEYVPWELFRYSPAKQWKRVWWVAFGEYLSKEDVKENFPNLDPDAVSYDWKVNKDGESIVPYAASAQGEEVDDPESLRTLVWTIWNKRDRKVYVISTGLPNEYMTEPVDDPLRLKDFFPCPQPLYGIKSTNSLVPVPDYIQYQDQAMELNVITERIRALVDALKRRGLYDSAMSELMRLQDAGDNEFIPVTNYAALVEKGVENVVWEMPIDGISTVLLNLYKQRDQIISIIYAITGISDLLRGDSTASDSATAQSIKAKYATSRIGPKQRQIANFARDLIRLQAEIMAEHFSSDSLTQMTGIDLPTMQQIQTATALAKQAQQPPPPPMPSEEQVMAILRNDKLRSFSVDIETDSTIVTKDEHTKQEITDFTTSMATLIQSLTPAAQAGLIPPPAAKELLMTTARKFQFGKDFEEAMAANANWQPQPPQPDPLKMQELQLQQQKQQQDSQNEQAKVAAHVQTAQLKSQTDLALATQQQAHDKQMKALDVFGTVKLPTQDGQEVTPFGLMQGLLTAFQGFMQQVQTLVQVNATIANQNAQLIKLIGTPTQIVRDENNRIIGAQKLKVN